MRTTSKGRVSSTISYRDDLLERIRRSPDLGAGYLNAALAEAPKVFLIALKDVVDAQGGVSRLAKKTGMHRVSLHSLLSAKGNPRLDNLNRILDALNIRLTMAPKIESRKRKKAG